MWNYFTKGQPGYTRFKEVLKDAGINLLNNNTKKERRQWDITNLFYRIPTDWYSLVISSIDSKPIDTMDILYDRISILEKEIVELKQILGMNISGDQSNLRQIMEGTYSEDDDDKIPVLRRDLNSYKLTRKKYFIKTFKGEVKKLWSHFSPENDDVDKMDTMLEHITHHSSQLDKNNNLLSIIVSNFQKCFDSKDKEGKIQFGSILAAVYPSYEMLKIITKRDFDRSLLTIFNYHNKNIGSGLPVPINSTCERNREFKINIVKELVEYCYDHCKRTAKVRKEFSCEAKLMKHMNRNECQSLGSSIRKNKYSNIQFRDNSSYDGFNIEEVVYIMLSEITSGPTYINCENNIITSISVNSFNFGYATRFAVKAPPIEDIVKKSIRWCWEYGNINNNTKISAESCRELLLQLGTEVLSQKYETCPIFRTAMEMSNGEPIFTDDMIPAVIRIKNQYIAFQNSMISVHRALALTKSMTHNDIKENLFFRLKNVDGFQIYFINDDILMNFVIHIMNKVITGVEDAYGKFLQKSYKDFKPIYHKDKKVPVDINKKVHNVILSVGQDTNASDETNISVHDNTTNLNVKHSNIINYESQSNDINVLINGNVNEEDDYDNTNYTEHEELMLGDKNDFKETIYNIAINYDSSDDSSENDDGSDSNSTSDLIMKICYSGLLQHSDEKACCNPSIDTNSTLPLTCFYTKDSKYCIACELRYQAERNLRQDLKRVRYSTNDT